ncbi:MAG: 4Fe-4S binding protein [Gammaproteobacteria bacterium]|nr:4Fe-4S binding protein [Gammaproteobacteria bacterium]
MKANEALSKIPINKVGIQDARGLAWKRQAAQIAAILILIAIPVTGLFRIDVSSGFVVLGHQIWFSDFEIVFGFWLAVAATMIMVYSTVGTAFCGWACPQNTFSSLANKLTAQHLGKRAVVDWENRDRAKVAANKNHVGNWLLLTIKLLAMSLLLAIIPMLYFFPPQAIWSFITFQPDERLAASLYWIYTVFVLVTFVNLAVIRHFMCRYMCIYRMWQYLFKTKDTLHIEYDEARRADCDKCSYCLTQCMVEIDPRATTQYDSCTNCGACITACDNVHSKKGVPGLLKFKLGPRTGMRHDPTKSVASVRERLFWVVPVWLLGVGLFAWGLWTYQPYHLTVYQSGPSIQGQVNEYRINLASKMLEPVTLNVSVEGLNSENFALTAPSYRFEGAGRGDLFLTLRDLPAGLHSFVVRAKAENGWSTNFRIQHFVAGAKYDK